MAVVVSILVLLAIVGLVVGLGYILVNDQRRENEKRRLVRKQLREQDDTQ